MKLKKNDIVLSKKTLKTYYKNVKEGNYYKVDDIHVIKGINNIYYGIIYYINGIGFLFPDEISGAFGASHTYYFEDYFYSMREIRKLKLEKINETYSKSWY